MNFSEFMNSNYKNFWIKEKKGLNIYIRKGISPTSGSIELASISADPKGNGALTQFLNKIEESHSVFIENVINERLVVYLKKRGYTRVNDGSLAPFSYQRKKREAGLGDGDPS